MACRRGRFVPGRGVRWITANSASSVRRGSITMSGTPARARWRMRAPTMGWFSVGLAPTTSSSRARSMSAKLLVAAPVPKVWPRPAALGAWHTRAQQSTLCVPRATRANFCAR